MKTIRARLLVMLLSGLTLVLAAGGISVYLIEQSNLLNQFDAGLENRAHSIAALVKQEPVGTIWEFGDAPQTLLAETYFEIMHHSGEVVKRSDNLGVSTLPSNAPNEGDLVYQDVDLPGDLKGRAAWYAFRPRMDEDDWEGRDVSEVTPPLLVVGAALNREPVDQALATLRGALWLVGGAVGVTAMLLVLFGTRWGLAPLHRLSTQLGDVGSSTISWRFEADRVPGELVPVYRELNAMLDRVEKTIERER
ncbi:MAG: hypothetical protein O7G85_11435, partial [Planctomycetota bacterium]|nr:hypothetical protein [Planctomycetota bacterium]